MPGPHTTARQGVAMADAMSFSETRPYPILHSTTPRTKNSLQWDTRCIVLRAAGSVEGAHARRGMVQRLTGDQPSQNPPFPGGDSASAFRRLSLPPRLLLSTTTTPDTSKYVNWTRRATTAIGPPPQDSKTRISPSRPSAPPLRRLALPPRLPESITTAPYTPK